MLELFKARFEMKSLDEKGKFVGYGSTFGNVDEGKDVVETGAYDQTLAEHKAADTVPGMYWQHKKDEPVGEWIAMEVDNVGLKMTGQLWLTPSGATKADQTYNMLKAKGPKGLSIGYGVKEGGSRRDTKSGVRYLSKLQLNEVSPVSFPMNTKCGILSVKSSEQEMLEHLFKNADGTLKTIREFEKVLRDGGLSDTQAKGILAGGYARLAPRDVGDLSDLLSAIKKYTPTA